MRSLSRLSRHASRIVFVSLLMLLIVITANAYTVVMRGGRRVEIPSHFVVTKNTLTYEVSKGFQITLAMAAIDIPATERANNEEPGSLLRREESGANELAVAAPVSAPATRTITNRDLVTSMRRRRESELAYETRRKQLGLPTLEESRRKTATVPDFRGTELEQMLAADKESEQYWRGRASALRTETAVLDAELNYIRARLDEMPASASSGVSIIDGPFEPYITSGDVGGRNSYPRSRRDRPLVYGSQRDGSVANGRVRSGGARRDPGYRNGRRYPDRGVFGGGQVGIYGGGTTYDPYGQTYGYPYGQPYDYSYERSELVTQFNQLATTRAGLNARWRQLEDEARRAGAQPGWLRP